ncbi:MAG TPA: cytochrome c [Myxococcaceae bacterium]|nr:cytochrome c [Myxococcaceae bacterium]
MKTRLALLLSLSLATAAHASEDAAALWKARCKNCHGEDGKARTKTGRKESIVDMSQPAWQKAQTDADIREFIVDGSPRNKKMKPFKDKLTAEQIDSLVAYIRTLKAD